MQPYQQDSYRTTFRSEVADTRGAWVRLAETYFYPTSGGQPHDTGTLESAAGQPTTVTDVKLEDGQIWHHLDGTPPPVGAPISGTLDWARRFRHMQRHSAQHLLSQVFVQLDAAFETRSVSLAGPVCTLDLAGEPRAADLGYAEVLVNRLAYANLEIRSFEVDESELARYPLRRPAKVRGRVRLVQMGDAELSACGGTHLRRTAEALPIKVLGQTRVKGALARVQFSAGWEALDDYHAKHETLTTLALGFSAQPGEVPDRVEGMRLELTETQRALAQSRQQLAQSLAERLRRDSSGPALHVLDEDGADLLGPLAQELVRFPETVALLASRQGDRVQFLFARHEAAAGDMREALQVALASFGGRGGGSAARAQGSGALVAEVESGVQAALEAAAHTLEPRP